MPKKNRVIILGSGGHARSLIEVLKSGANSEIIGILDPDKAKAGTTVDGIPIIGQDDQLESLRTQFDFFIVGVGSSGANFQTRSELYRHCIGNGLFPYSVISNSSIISSSASLGKGTQILHSAVINAGAKLGEHVIVNTAAVIEHDCLIGDHSHIATAATLAGGVSIGENVFIGCGATVSPGVKIGDRAVIGAGAVVIKNVPSSTTVVGNPARQIS